MLLIGQNPPRQSPDDAELFESFPHLELHQHHEMRRIARPQRSIALPSSSSHLLRPQTSRFPCQFALAPCNSAAPFSTTPHPGFLLSDKQDKKKHQAFVRRWQKRLLGDSEPIGAHVDPYDGTSPVRISPEEYGEEEEVLVDDDGNAVTKDQSLEILYRKAESGHGLRVVGGKDLQRETEEEKMAVEYEMLTGKTYTPLTLRMANEIEDLTGTPYSLLGENLMMAQVWQEETGKPYTEFRYVDFLLCREGGGVGFLEIEADLE
jgi:hypothetical protein